MKRLLWAVTGVVCAANLAPAGDPPAGGRERSLIEQEFHLADRPTPHTTLPIPTTRPSGGCR